MADPVNWFPLLAFLLSMWKGCAAARTHGLTDTPSNFTTEFRMPNVQPTTDDQYMCTVNSLDAIDLFVYQFEAVADAGRAHHILLFGCEGVSPDHIESTVWDCTHEEVCQGMKIMFAWAKNAPPTTLPRDVAFRIGRSRGMRFLVMQIHYAHPLPAGEKDNSGLRLFMTTLPQKYEAAIYLLGLPLLNIPPKAPKVHGDVNCHSSSTNTIYPFAYRVHAHKLGVVITGYIFDPMTYKFTEIARGNPQWPQAFYPMKSIHEVKPDDILVARCTFNSTERNTYTQIGHTAGDEMCNLYLMFYEEAGNEAEYLQCWTIEEPGLVDILPEDSDKPLPRNPLLEEHATHSSHTMHGSHHNHLDEEPQIQEDSSFINRIPEKKGEHSTVTAPGPGKELAHSGLFVVPNWGSSKKHLGQISAVSLDPDGNVVIFHRGDHVWNMYSFLSNNQYNEVDKGPITANTIVVFNASTGALLKEWGSNLFYMPHGLTVDNKRNVWVTDVALHQVFKFKLTDNVYSVALSLGTQFEPGNDDHHFCKPTAVALAKNGDFFVSDGYCNNRIIKYASDGRKLLQWGQRTANAYGYQQPNPPPYAFAVPHALALAEEKGLVCVADRENGRIQCFSMTNGTFHCQINSPTFGTIYSIAYSPDEGHLYAVNGPQPGLRRSSSGFVIDLGAREILSTFSPNNEGFSNPHDIAANHDGSQVYVVEINPYKIWKFVKEGASESISPKTLVTVTTTTTTSKPEQKEHSHPGRMEVHTIEPPAPNSHQAALSVAEEPESTKNDSPSSGMGPSLIIMALLSVPILVMVVIMVVVRLRKRGSLQMCCKEKYHSAPSGSGFSLGTLLDSRRGFEKLCSEESEDDCSGSSDSEVENVTNSKIKTKLKATQA